MSERLERILHEVRYEVEQAQAKFPPFNSPHEGYAVIKEEVDELWEAIRHYKRPDGDPLPSHGHMDEEARQVAAMAVRFLHDIIGYSPDEMAEHAAKDGAHS